MVNGKRKTSRPNLGFLKKVKKHWKEKTGMTDSYLVREWKFKMAYPQ
jgi:hypothetical protein